MLSKKKSAIAGAALLALSGASSGGWFFLSGSPAQAEEKGHAAAAEEHAAPTTSFVTVDQVAAPITKDGRVRSYVVVEAALEVEDAGAVKPRLPKVLDAWLVQVFAMADRGNFSDGRIDTDLLRKNLTDAAERALGEHAVKGIAFRKLSIMAAR